MNEMDKETLRRQSQFMNNWMVNTFSKEARVSKVKTKSEVKLVDAKESLTAKKIKAPKKAAVALGPTKATAAAKAAPAAKPHRSRSEAAKAAWAAHRDTITAGINRYFAQRKAAAKPKPKAKKVAAQAQPQA